MVSDVEVFIKKRCVSDEWKKRCPLTLFTCAKSLQRPNSGCEHSEVVNNVVVLFVVVSMGINRRHYFRSDILILTPCKYSHCALKLNQARNLK